MTPTLLEQSVGTLAFAGDLSMGQPPDHSPRVALLAARVARETGANAAMQATAARLAMLRWAGCTANAREFAELFGDDVRGRAELIAGRNPFVAAEPPNPASLHTALVPISTAHCETVALICRRLKLPEDLIIASSDFFENWDGSGLPHGKAGEDIHEAAQYVALAGDIEVYTRNFGAARAALLIESRGGKVHEPGLALAASKHMGAWLRDGEGDDPHASAVKVCDLRDLQPASLTRADIVALFADYADLKRPELTGSSRLAQDIARDMARAAAHSADEIEDIGAAAALSDLGQVAVANTAYGTGHNDSEALRLAPHWTERILSRAPSLANAAALAGLAYERMDGSGFSRGLAAPSQPFEARIVQVARYAAAGRRLHGLGNDWPVAHLQSRLTEEVNAGRLDLRAVRLALQAMGARNLPSADNYPTTGLTDRERDVLEGLIGGRSNKEIARALDLSPKTVGTHVEKLFRKLGVSSRAAAAMVALDAGLITR
ncbi:MAG: HD domain-containing phosphohydrolase [Pseudomonadota bacterium]